MKGVIEVSVRVTERDRVIEVRRIIDRSLYDQVQDQRGYYHMFCDDALDGVLAAESVQT